MTIAVALLAIAALEAVPRILKLNPRWETPPMEIRRRMAAVRRALAILLTLTPTLAGTVKAQAQSTYDWTLVGNAISGSGVFATTGSLTFAPIDSLSGTLNGAPLALVPTSHQVGNMFNTNTMGIVPFYPLFMTANGASEILSHEDMQEPTMLNGVPVTFLVTVAPPPVSQVPFGTRLPVLGSVGGPAMPWRAAATTPARRSLSPVVIEVSVPAAIAVGTSVYWYIRHRRSGRRDAVPAGRTL